MNYVTGIMALVLLSLSGCEAEPSRPDYGDSFSAPEKMIAQAGVYQERIEEVSDAPVWMIANINDTIPNIIVVEGDSGLIIVDTGLRTEDGEKAVRMIRERTDKPIEAVIYTHHHIDHAGGASAFVSPDDAASGKVKVIGADNFMTEMQDETGVIGPLMAVRAMYMYGMLLDPKTDGQHYFVGLGGRVKPGPNQYIVPNTLISDPVDMTIAGHELRIFKTGGESASHIAIYMPAYGLMLSGDEIQGPTYPNLHSLRGTKPRDAEKWITALDRMRAFNPRTLVPSHGPVVEGAAKVAALLQEYRDAIQWTHDQAVRLINQGYTQEELAEALPALPEHLKTQGWTEEWYGTMKHNVRNYYTGYVSWWDGDPATLDPTPRVERASRTVALMGGRDAVFAEAEKAIEGSDPQWASELLTLLVRIDHDDMEARHLKARALRQIGYKTLNTNWRGFYLTGAMELDGVYDTGELAKRSLKSFSPKAVPSKNLLSLLRYRLVPKEAGDKHLTVGFVFPDRDEAFTLELRNQVLEVRVGAEEDMDAVITMGRSVYDKLLVKKIGLLGGIASGDISISGSKMDMLSFFGSFDAELKGISLVVR